MTSKEGKGKPVSATQRRKNKQSKPDEKPYESRNFHQELEQRAAKLTETNRQLKRKIFDLYTIFEISRNFNSVLDYQSLLDSFVLTTLAQVGAVKGAVFLKEDGQAEKYVLAKGKGSGYFPGRGLFFEAGSKLLEYLTRLNRPADIGELMNELAAQNEKAILENFHPGLIVPLIYQTRLSGLVLVSDKISGHDFHLDDIEFLSILGNQISVAIENAQLYEAERKAVKQLRSTQQQLVASERLAALGEMSAKIAHEINNPLGIIDNYLLLLRRSLGSGIEAGNYTDIIGQEIARIARIVKELLDFHRPDGMTFRKTDVVKVIEDVLLLMGPRFETSRIEVNRRFGTDCPLVEGSPDNLKQVFLNLVINACDVMKDGGTLEVAVKRIEDELSIRFTDTGPGIPDDVRPRIFEPFFTTKPASAGTGLGLSVCYGIIKNHGGTITYKNTDTGGCFEIRLLIAGRWQRRDESD